MTTTRPSPAPRLRDPALRRARIEETARRLFSELGYAETSTARIAREAGISQGTLFHHYPTKRELLGRIAELEAERVLAVAFEELDVRRPPESLRPVFERLFDYARTDPAAYRLFCLDADLADASAGHAARREGVIRGLSALLAGWSARGHLRRLEPDVTATLVFALVDSSVQRLLFEDRWAEQGLWLDELERGVGALLGLAVEPGGRT